MDKIGTIVENAINSWNNDKSNLISILLDIQDEYNYLPQEALISVATKLDIPVIDVYAVATFYTVFSLKPRGKHIINVCVGTACHVRGGQRILDRIQRNLQINPGETTEDKLFTLETVRCLGCCALGPVMVIDGTYYSHLTTKAADSIVDKYKRIKLEMST